MTKLLYDATHHNHAGSHAKSSANFLVFARPSRGPDPLDGHRQMAHGKGDHVDVVPHSYDRYERCGTNQRARIGVGEVVDLKSVLIQ